MYILFDIGGTHMRVAGTRDFVSFAAEPSVLDTPQKFDEAMSLIAETAKTIAGGEVIAGAAGGVAGVLSADKQVLKRSPNLPEWNGVRPVMVLSDALGGAPVHIDNDAAIVGLGEACSGAGKGHSIVAYITVSTGVGGARLVNGKIDVGRFGFEPGHQVIDMDGTACPTCNAEGGHGDGPGHLEGYVSGTATERRFGKKPYEITDEFVWSELARWLAYGLNNTIVHWSPDVVVLGGSMIVGDPKIDIEEVKRNLDEVLDIFDEKPILVPAQLGKLGGLYGAMALLKQKRSV